MREREGIHGRDRNRLKAWGSASTQQQANAQDQPSRWRLFVAVPLPENVRDRLAQIQNSFPRRTSRAVRWVDPVGIHLTLRFLGDTDPDQVPSIASGLSDAASQTGTFQVRLGGPGAFPSLGRPRVLWLGVSGETDRLKRFQARVEGALSKIGIVPEDRPFHPHLTVGRIQRGTPPPQVREAGEAFAKVDVPEQPPVIPVKSIILYRSHLGREGARYEALEEAELG